MNETNCRELFVVISDGFWNDFQLSWRRGRGKKKTTTRGREGRDVIANRKGWWRPWRMSRRSTCRCRKLDRVFEAHAVQGDPDFTPPSPSLSLSGALDPPFPLVGKLLRMKTPMSPSSACHDPPITYKPRIGAEFIPPLLLPFKRRVNRISNNFLVIIPWNNTWNVHARLSCHRFF